MEYCEKLSHKGKDFLLKYPKCANCDGKAKYFCTTHAKRAYCGMHKLMHHTKIGCDVKLIPNMAEVVRSQCYISGYITDIINNVQLHNLSEVVPDVNYTLDLFKSKIDELKLKTETSTKEGIYQDYTKFESETNQLMTQLQHSATVNEISMELMQRSYFQRANNLEDPVISARIRNTVNDRVEKIQEQMEKQKQKELKDLRQELTQINNEEKKQLIAQQDKFKSQENTQKLEEAQKIYNKIKKTSAKFD